jgi:hypothetical protein
VVLNLFPDSLVAAAIVATGGFDLETDYKVKQKQK